MYICHVCLYTWCGHSFGQLICTVCGHWSCDYIQGYIGQLTIVQGVDKACVPLDHEYVAHKTVKSISPLIRQTRYLMLYFNIITTVKSSSGNFSHIAVHFRKLFTGMVQIIIGDCRVLTMSVHQRIS